MFTTLGQLRLLVGLWGALVTPLALHSRRLQSRHELAVLVPDEHRDLANLRVRAIELDGVADHELHVCLPSLDRVVFVCVELLSNGTEIAGVLSRDDVEILWDAQQLWVDRLAEDKGARRRC